MEQRGLAGFLSALLAFLRRAGLPRIIEWVIVSWMYLWIAGFVIAAAVATVRGYVGVFREVRAFERSSKGEERRSDGVKQHIINQGAEHAHHSPYGDTG